MAARLFARYVDRSGRGVAWDAAVLFAVFDAPEISFLEISGAIRRRLVGVVRWLFGKSRGKGSQTIIVFGGWVGCAEDSKIRL